jgi:hypothetical protein
MAEIPTDERRKIALANTAPRLELDNRFWEPGDEWVDGPTGIAMDVMYRPPEWIEEQLARSLERCEASVGFSTCFWYNVLHSIPLYDPAGWYAQLQHKADQPYPDDLRRAVVAKNFPILRDNLSAYAHQIEKARGRGDLVSLNHRTAAFLASYFDILFALNRQPHPGEKRLVEWVEKICPIRPAGLGEQVEALITATAARDGDWSLPLNHLVDALEGLLEGEGLLSKK